ncbi:thiamine pyrophosphate-binding protein [Stutzerimonas xanthomarina]|uniref:2-succinyl-5-enolpyruvyl-6-hydroxy-3-cyclohexene-1-carboxylate synthase n=2 Tax=Stutzerimonas xanthomarina TaxID=271420 RepID=A0A1M5P8R2_9GAMM|nr:thiamine pyrophosphate-binding protein [Stutzerimonas xanthomarina]MCP9338557.1 thiamine pyrophosphate-binding protein [Stutzerimonas xanthomarina]SEH77300.1 2-succinyl-5-enolpyruvyl-6-hydroxy-3-cyclohexene-1-carboxylate synthase [Stutzerimonas xanthomarina]SHG97603.1 2-succinyl-5-enolpyruvyl-6-hydroxy-3-cyclohexene-1-carboxylate synthase [Stutzerimonas xanthomarina DSM 18231]
MTYNYAYTREKNAQVILYLLKAHNIRHVIASPGTTNTALVSSMQQDPHFIMYSSVDERSAAYMACGLAAELNEPVVISCTGATASRNYLPGMTEAFYRKLPVLAITSMQAFSRVGHHVAQVIDRSSMPKDAVTLSVELPIVKDDEDVWDCEIKVNKAILELKRHGGGPVHINLPTTYSKPYDVKQLPDYRVIERISEQDRFPELGTPDHRKIAVFVGAHKTWSKAETEALESFCEQYGAVVFCDHSSGYQGKNRLLFALAAAQTMLDKSPCQPDVLIHIGEVTGDYATLGMAGRQVWRVSEDGEIRDTFRKLRYVFAMPEQAFFAHYAGQAAGQAPVNAGYYEQCRQQLQAIRDNLPELPLSNAWLASQLAHRIPAGSTIHFGILNSLRCWNFYELPASVTAASNVGGFGIDGGLSSLIGASLANPNKLYFAVIGDLAFFYDLNVLGNRHAGNNLRILLVNNGKGTEFRQYNHHAAYFGEGAEEFVAASGHFGCKSPTLVKNFATDLGYEYLAATSKEEFAVHYQRFIAPEVGGKSIIFEVFTDSELESQALESIQNIASNPAGKTKEMAKKLLGPKGIETVKRLLKR